jgi:hypothetical protein
VVGGLCFERRAVDPALVARLRADASEVMAAAGRDGVVADPFWEARRAPSCAACSRPAIPAS